MTLAADVATRLGTPLLVELTNFDDQTATATNTARLDAALADATALVRTEAGLVEPADASTDAHATWLALVVKAVRYQLLWYRAPEGQQTKDALAEFRDAAKTWRSRTAKGLATDSPVDVSAEDVEARPPRFAPSHFEGWRIG